MLLGASFVPLPAEGRGTLASAPSRLPRLAEGKAAPMSPCTDRRTAGKPGLLLGCAEEALLAEGKGALPSATAAACALAFLPKSGTLLLLTGIFLTDAMGAAAIAALLSDSPSWLCARDGVAELEPALPRSLLLRLALGPRAVVGAGMAPEAEEERERVVRGLGCWAAALAFGCCRAVEGLQSKEALAREAVLSNFITLPLPFQCSCTRGTGSLGAMACHDQQRWWQAHLHVTP